MLFGAFFGSIFLIFPPRAALFSKFWVFARESRSLRKFFELTNKRLIHLLVCGIIVTVILTAEGGGKGRGLMADSTLQERINQIISDAGISKAAFARSLGVTPNYVYIMSHGRVQKISPSLAMLIEEKYHCPADWVMTGETATSEVARELGDRLKGLDDKTLKSVNRFLNRKMKAREARSKK
jgi:transcriptional regulator with XRE-family HTH domain